MRRLYELSAAPNKIWRPLPTGDHNSSFLEEGYFEAISDFISSVTLDRVVTGEKERKWRNLPTKEQTDMFENLW